MQETITTFGQAVSLDGLCHDQCMVTRLCPYCDAKADMAPVWAMAEQINSDQFGYRYKNRLACMCANCHELSTALIRDYHSAVTSSSQEHEMRKALADSRVEWSPLSAPSPDFPHVPTQVARCAVEAHMAHAIGADAASILMARTTIEATAKNQGIDDGSLYNKIETLKEQGLVRPAMVTIAHAIRILGNDMAHGDVEDLPTSEDATDALRLMDMILEEVFQASATAAEILSRRDARNA